MRPHELGEREARFVLLHAADDLASREPGLPQGDSFQGARESNMLWAGEGEAYRSSSGHTARGRGFSV